MEISWSVQDWVWGLALIAVTVVVHATGVVMMAIGELKLRGRMERRRFRLRPAVLTVIGVVGAIGLLLSVLHGIEYAIWAVAYAWLGALDSPMDAMLYSIDSMTTRGASGLTLQPHWLLMGALEAANGMLLFGISTAYIFAVMQAWWPFLRSLPR